MNKFLLLLFFFSCSIIYGQDSLLVETATLATAENKNVFSEKDIQIDNDSIEAKSFDKDFKKKYNDPKFIYEFKAPEKNAWDRFKEWLANFFKKLFGFSDNRSSQNFVSILLKTLAIAIVVYVIYMITKALMNKEGQWIFGKNSDRKNIQYSEIERNILAVDFEKLIKDTLQSGEKRLSIRYYYMWLLKRMAERELIVWDLEKTNSDYIYELKNENQKIEFAYLSYLYNHIWYGEFEIDEESFAKAKNAFINAIKTI
ncbi:MAG: DUF4129 domain-containing protein [Bacteroidota bacterium]